MEKDVILQAEYVLLDIKEYTKTHDSRKQDEVVYKVWNRLLDIRKIIRDAE